MISGPPHCSGCYPLVVPSIATVSDADGVVVGTLCENCAMRSVKPGFKIKPLLDAAPVDEVLRGPRRRVPLTTSRLEGYEIGMVEAGRVFTDAISAVSYDLRDKEDVQIALMKVLGGAKSTMMRTLRERRALWLTKQRRAK